MNPAPNPFKTRIVNGPKNQPDCEPLELMDAEYNNMPVMISAWEPTTEEQAAISRGEKIWLFIYGNQHPMVSLTAGERP